MRPLFGSDERAELLAYLDEDGFFTEFRRTEAFEAEIGLLGSALSVGRHLRKV